MDSFSFTKIYPLDWDKKSKEEKTKKEKEFDVASFLLDNYPPAKELFEGADNLCVEFDDSPDFFVYPNEESTPKLGLEITQCFSGTKRNYLSIHKDIEDICKSVIEDIQKTNDPKYQKFNYIDITLTHDVMVCEQYDKHKLESELRDFIVNENKYDGEYVCHLDIGYSAVYLKNENDPNKDSPQILLRSNMAYIVPRICDLIQMQKEAGIKGYDPVLQIIKKKEEKLIKYKQKCKYDVHKWWLCIDIPKSSLMNPISYHLPDNFTSGYDKIFLVSRFFYGFGVHVIYGL